MGRKKSSFDLNDGVEFVNKLMVERPFFVFVISLVLVCWAVEKWVFSVSNWVPLVVAVWATFQVNFIFFILFLIFFCFFKYFVSIKIWNLMNVYIGFGIDIVNV